MSKKKTNLKKAFEDLTKIVDTLESAEIDLETALPLFKKGLLLARQIKKRLSEIENEIIEVQKDYQDLK